MYPMEYQFVGIRWGIGYIELAFLVVCEKRVVKEDVLYLW